MTYVRLSAGNKWRAATDADNGSANFSIKLKYLPSSKLMVHVTGDNGVLRKSANSGKTWTNAAMLAGCDACLDVCESPDGIIYGLFTASGSSTAHVGKSINALVSWTDIHTHDAGKQAFNIACSSERAAFNTIAFTARDDVGGVGNEGTDSELVISTDGGTTWNTKSLGYKIAADDADAPLISISAGGIQVLLRGEPSSASITLTNVELIYGTNSTDLGTGLPEWDGTVVANHFYLFYGVSTTPPSGSGCTVVSVVDFMSTQHVWMIYGSGTVNKDSLVQGYDCTTVGGIPSAIDSDYMFNEDGIMLLSLPGLSGDNLPVDEFVFLLGYEQYSITPAPSSGVVDDTFIFDPGGGDIALLQGYVTGPVTGPFGYSDPGAGVVPDFFHLHLGAVRFAMIDGL